jgi:thymidylate synthase ThyX
VVKSGKDEGAYTPRIYPLDAHSLSEEQIAVAFAMTSRRPEPFDEIAAQVSQEKAADFHERWVLGYGHASVAEHAVLHLAVENISRLACDTLEDNRLASYTEKSSRYQVMPEDYFYVPNELDPQPELRSLYLRTCQHLFAEYRRLIDACMDHLRRVHPQNSGERESAYNLRLRRIATDSCRALLPAATLTNVGVTANARVLEHAISKLLSSELAEERELGLELRDQGRTITPTLIKYADQNPYLERLPAVQRELAWAHKMMASAELVGGALPYPTVAEPAEDAGKDVQLVQWDDHAEQRLTAALVYKQASVGYEEVWRRVNQMSAAERQDVVGRCVAGMGPHDAPVREFELVDYTFEFSLDYGAFREFKRHRMQSYVSQPLTITHGYRVPPLIIEAAQEGRFRAAIQRSEEAFHQVAQRSAPAAQYLVTHAHNRRVLSRMNLRECYHLFKLRSSALAHYSIRGPIVKAMKLAVDTHPELFRHLVLRDYPDWWPFPKPKQGVDGA